MDESLTFKEAYLAMFAYLSATYHQCGGEELGGLLGSMSLLADGGTADPAVWPDWIDAIQKAKSGRVTARLDLS